MTVTSHNYYSCVKVGCTYSILQHTKSRVGCQRKTFLEPLNNNNNLIIWTCWCVFYTQGGHTNAYSITHSLAQRHERGMWYCYIIFIKNTWAIVAAESCFLDPCGMPLCWGPKMKLENLRNLRLHKIYHLLLLYIKLVPLLIDVLLCLSLRASIHPIVLFNCNFYFDGRQPDIRNSELFLVMLFICNDAAENLLCV